MWLSLTYWGWGKWPPFRRWHAVSNAFLPEASLGLRELSSPASLCVSVCVSLCVNHLLVRAITRDPFKLGSQNLDQRCKRPWLRSLLFLGWLTLTLKVKSNFKIKIYPILSLWVCLRLKSPTIEVRIPYLNQKCILALLRSILILELNDLDLQYFAPLIHFASVCIYLVRPLPVNAPHFTWHRISGFLYAQGGLP